MERIEQIEALIRRIEISADPDTMAGVRELVEAILEYHGAGFERTLDIVRQSSGGDAAVREIARDALTGSLLLLYGLHPEDFDTRVRRAIDTIPGVLLTGLTDGVVRLRATSAETSREAVEQILYSAAPEVAGVEIEGLRAPSAFVPLKAILGTT
jgi:hypothetical protein